MSVNILIVEDDDFTVDIVRTTLAPLGATVAHVESVQEAFNTITQHSVDLVIADLRLPAPSTNGVELVQMMKQDARYNKIPIIAITASGGEYIMKAMKAGCDDYLEKPFNLDRLRKMVTHHLGATT